MSALAPFHTALYARLNADSGLAAYQHASMAAESPARTGVDTFDFVPDSAKYPHIALESHSEARFGMFGSASFDDTAQLGVWDNFRGKERILEVLELITAALVSPLTVEGFGSVRAKMDLVSVINDPSGLKHGIYRVRAILLG